MSDKNKNPWWKRILAVLGMFLKDIFFLCNTEKQKGERKNRQKCVSLKMKCSIGQKGPRNDHGETETMPRCKLSEEGKIREKKRGITRRIVVCGLRFLGSLSIYQKKVLR